MKITARNIVYAIASLPRGVDYNYISPNNRGLIRIEDVVLPEGPILFRRWIPVRGGTFFSSIVESISSQMIWRIANALTEGEPISFDRVLGASYNTRSVLEALMAVTPEFYYCYPGRIEDLGGRCSVKHGHKHLIWRPDIPHEEGKLVELEVRNMEVSEIPSKTVTYDGVVIPAGYTLDNHSMDIDVVRRHTQIQIALYLIGLQLGYRTWIAQNDKGIIYKDKPLLSQPGIVDHLANETSISAFPGAEGCARFIDCIWFENGSNVPAVMEVEHSTGVTSGLTRMKGLKDKLPRKWEIRYVIVASDELRDKVVQEANKTQFRDLNTRYFPYSAVEELYFMCTHRHLCGVSEDFLDCYMEKVCV